LRATAERRAKIAPRADAQLREDPVQVGAHRPVRQVEPLAYLPVGHPLLERFNSGKVSAMLAHFEPGAVFVARDGRTVTDPAKIAAELERDLSLGLPLEAKARHVFVAGDIAQIVLDWSIDGTGPDGKHVHLEGSASDIVRRGADGRWRYLIDNALGTAVRQPA
jgi:ketosteroid isomerase-like protein